MKSTSASIIWVDFEWLFGSDCGILWTPAYTFTCKCWERSNLWGSVMSDKSLLNPNTCSRSRDNYPQLEPLVSFLSVRCDDSATVGVSTTIYLVRSLSLALCGHCNKRTSPVASDCLIICELGLFVDVASLRQPSYRWRKLKMPNGMNLIQQHLICFKISNWIFFAFNYESAQ